MASNSSTLPRVTFQTPEKPGEESSHRKLGKLTIKYNRKDLQRWLDLEEWINTQLQELYQCRLREESEEAAPEPQIDLEDLLEVPNEEQKLKLQEILHECSSPTETIGTTPQSQRDNWKEFALLIHEPWKRFADSMVLANYKQDFITELLSRLKGLRKVTHPQKK